MPLIAYPSVLPGPQAPLRLVPRERRAVPGIEGAFAPRSRQRDFSGGLYEATWVYSPSEMAIWRAWFQDDLLYGHRWFADELPLDGGFSTRVVRYVGEQRREHLAVGIYRITATLEVRGASELPQTVVETDGLLCHFDNDVGGEVISAIGPNVQYGVGTSLTSVVSQFGGSSGQLNNGIGESNYFSASGIAGGLDRNWRFELWLRPSTATSHILTLSGSGFSLSLSFLIGTAAFGVNQVSAAGSGGGVTGSTWAVLNAQNHCGVEYTVSNNLLSLFGGGQRRAILGSEGVPPFPGGVFSTALIGGQGYVDEARFRFNMTPYGASYAVPTSAFSPPDPS